MKIICHCVPIFLLIKKEELLRHIHPHIRFFSSMTVNIRPSIFKH